MTPPSSSRSKPTSADEPTISTADLRQYCTKSAVEIVAGGFVGWAGLFSGPLVQIDRLDRSLGCRTYVEENQESQSASSPVEGEPRQASQHGSRLTASRIRDDVADCPADPA